MAKGTEVQKVAGSTSKCGRDMERKNAHLNWGGLTGVSSAVATANSEKSAEAIVVRKFL